MDKKTQELESKLEGFEKHVEDSINMNISSDQESINNGEYKYLVESYNMREDCELSEELQEALEDHPI